MKALNLGIRFLLELGMLASLAYWGIWITDGFWLALLLGAGAPLLAAGIWGLFIAPKALRRLRDPLRVSVEIDLFIAAAVALAFSVSIQMAIAFALAVAVNITLMFVWKQRDH